MIKSNKDYIKLQLEIYIKTAELEGMCKDDYETELLNVLDEIGIDFSR